MWFYRELGDLEKSHQAGYSESCTKLRCVWLGVVKDCSDVYAGSLQEFFVNVYGVSKLPVNIQDANMRHKNKETKFSVLSPSLTAFPSGEIIHHPSIFSPLVTKEAKMLKTSVSIFEVGTFHHWGSWYQKGRHIGKQSESHGSHRKIQWVFRGNKNRFLKTFASWNDVAIL